MRHLPQPSVWTTDLDWSGVTTRTSARMSLPLNRPATGAPLITGRWLHLATVGQELAVDVTGIEDEDGLHDIEYTYQWVRVDADGTSNEEDITDATDDTYTLTDDDLGKKVKIEVSFADDFGSDEQRTSAPTDTVTAVAMTTPGVTVSTTALTVTEEDTTGASYTVVLDSQPTATVTVTVAGHAGTDVTPSPTSLTFTTTTWGTAQTVTVTAGDDADTANDSVTLTHSAASTDSEYQGISIDGVAVTVTDNDAPPGVTVSTSALTVTEEDTTGDSYTVVLDSQPTANVTVTVAAGHAGTDVTPSPTSLTFTPMNWGTAQTVTVTAGGDDADTANDSVALTHTAVSADSELSGHHDRRRDGDGGRQRRKAAPAAAAAAAPAAEHPAGGGDPPGGPGGHGRRAVHLRDPGGRIHGRGRRPADVYRGAERRRPAAVVADVRRGHADVHGHAGTGRQWARVRDGDGE